MLSGLDGIALSLRASELNRKYRDSSSVEVIGAAGTMFGDRTAAISSFGAESVVLLHMISTIKPDLPIIFLDTLRHFSETLSYKRDLIERLKLTNVIETQPDPNRLKFEDPKLDLAKRNPDQCCRMRKKLPMLEALESFDCFMTGQKNWQTEARSALSVFETQDRWIKVNPLARWTKEQLDEYIDENELPRHPLEAWGYLSVGCAPCTSPVRAGADPRAGRWARTAKTECGIHYPAAVELDWAC